VKEDHKVEETFRTIYGDDMLSSASKQFGTFVAVTTPSPWAIVQARLHHQPLDVCFIKGLEEDYLQRLADEVPDTDAIVGIGGGMAIDAAKYLAWKKGLSLFQIPTITSTDACFTSTIAVRREGKTVGTQIDVRPELIIVDYDIIRQGPARLNRAGIGDILAFHTSLYDWKLAARQGITDWDEELAKGITVLLKRAIAAAPEVGALSWAGIHALMEIFKESSDYFRKYSGIPFSCGSEHLFAWNLEWITGRHFVHGEVVCLGIALLSFLQANAPEEILQAIHAAKVRYKPEDIGVAWDNVYQAVVTLREFNQATRGWYTVVDERPVNASTFQAMKNFIKEAS